MGVPPSQIQAASENAGAGAGGSFFDSSTSVEVDVAYTGGSGSQTYDTGVAFPDVSGPAAKVVTIRYQVEGADSSKKVDTGDASKIYAFPDEGVSLPILPLTTYLQGADGGGQFNAFPFLFFHVLANGNLAFDVDGSKDYEGKVKILFGPGTDLSFDPVTP